MDDTNPPTVSLDSFLLPEKVVDMDFPGMDGLSFKVCFLSRPELAKLRKKCIDTKYDTRTRVPEEVLNETKFMEEYAKSIIKGWSGFKFAYLKEFLLADIGDQDPEAMVPYTTANAMVLLENSSVFDDWLQDCVSDLTNFTKDS